MDKTFDPRHLDIAAFAQSAGRLQGEHALADWQRLLQEQGDDASGANQAVRWQLQGRMTPVAGAAPQLGLTLRAEVNLVMQCQRCLAPVLSTVHAERDFVFVADEATAETMDEDSEADVLVISRDFDAMALIEDELILSLPLVPRHAVCPQALPDAAADADFASASERPHPFASLAALKKSP